MVPAQPAKGNRPTVGASPRDGGGRLTGPARVTSPPDGELFLRTFQLVV
jgi:hypothetical protein